MLRNRLAARLAAGAALMLATSVALADNCPFCAKTVVTNKDLATCFMEKYGAAAPTGVAVAVDLTGCARNRSIVQALPSPAKALGKPDTRFLLSPVQLECLRRKLADPALVLDPQASIDLGACG